MRGSGRWWAACRPTRARGPSKPIRQRPIPKKIWPKPGAHLNEADPVFMVNIMRHEDLWHPRHVLVKVVHVLDLHSVEERIRLCEIRGTTETVGWRKHLRWVLCPTEHRATANVGGPRGHSARILVGRLSVWRRGCSWKRRCSTGMRAWRGIDRARDTTGVRRWITGPVPVRPSTGIG